MVRTQVAGAFCAVLVLVILWSRGDSVGGWLYAVLCYLVGQFIFQAMLREARVPRRLRNFVFIV